MTQPSLFPCPFCGCQASLWTSQSAFTGHTDGGSTGHRVECEGNCHAMTCWWHTKAEAIENWNRRTARPQRIQLKRTRGWRLQAVSQALNGLPARRVTRPGLFGNPFRVTTGKVMGLRGYNATAAVHDFREWLAGSDQSFGGPDAEARRAALLARLPELRGKNLACWCPLDQPCHADALLELANREDGPE